MKDQTYLGPKRCKRDSVIYRPHSPSPSTRNIVVSLAVPPVLLCARLMVQLFPLGSSFRHPLQGGQRWDVASLGLGLLVLPHSSRDPPASSATACGSADRCRCCTLCPVPFPSGF